MTLRIQIDKKLEQQFRELAMKRFGYTKGALSKAAEEAFLQWALTQEEKKFEKDPVGAIDGLLSDVDIDSVELQHETKTIWTKKVLRNVTN